MYRRRVPEEGESASFSPILAFSYPPPSSSELGMTSRLDHPDMSSLPHHQRQYLAVRNPAFAQSPSREDETEYDPAGTPTPTLMDPMGQRRVVPQSSALSPISTPVVRMPGHSKAPNIVSPVSRRATHPSLHHIMNTEHMEQIGASSHASAGDKRRESFAVFGELPIGSLVHHKGPPDWGVIKISNIPYSVTKQEIIQFVGRQARLISSDKGCPIHIIMERSTAKTMDCYVEFETPSDAQETVDHINKVYEVGRAPRLGNRHVEVEFSNQDQLLKDLFPRAKCVVWNKGFPCALVNTDPYSTGFAGFFTSEEIIGAIRHAEIPHRSPFCAKCPQRTYESTISTLYKFPWYATELYTVDDRNQLFELTNRHILSLVSRIQKSNTIGLDQRLLRSLLHAGLDCPAFNDRQKYTLCVNSEDMSEIVNFPDFGKWFPFDTLVSLPNADRQALQYYAGLISRGTVPEGVTRDLPNKFPVHNRDLSSPFGRIWFEWDVNAAKRAIWNEAVHHEMMVLRLLVKTGWENHNGQKKIDYTDGSPTPTRGIDAQKSSNPSAPSSAAHQSRLRAESTSRVDVFATPARRPSMHMPHNNTPVDQNESPWGQKLFFYPSSKARNGFPGHRITQSSPNCIPPEDV
ncbi:hypothetical protein ATEIFO6365_0014019900 [Aspergillus terreus]|uniref:Uncharacterized protein n=1 Tax=Aspergillus terreus TaxID=33178 RepID=A0A5M3Z7C4_ASPTE|nr:hypothetical protein ATETN484_0008043900 [Aspergillus terreus]GFF21267.1 hypothetical protein ATEIFO6365_0014019900 [Aspergillus terreus]